MSSFKRATALAATAAVLLAVSAASSAAGSATYDAAVTAARIDYGKAVAGCNRMHGAEQQQCLRNADAARRAAVIRARDMHGGAKTMELNFPAAADGAAGDDLHDQGSQGGGVPTYRKLPGGERLPENLARNFVP